MAKAVTFFVTALTQQKGGVWQGYIAQQAHQMQTSVMAPGLYTIPSPRLFVINRHPEMGFPLSFIQPKSQES